MDKLQLAQLWAMTRYEFRMHWRRRGLIILTWSVVVVVGISILIAGASFQTLSSMNADAETVRKVSTAALILTLFSSVGVGLVFVLPLVAAETIPLDRQYGVRDLLDSLPLPTNVYLFGKLLGLWSAVLSAMGLVMVLTGVIWWFKAGAFNIGDYAEVWVFGITSIVVLNGSLGVLIPAAQATRRQALVVTLIGMGILLALFGGDMDGGDLRSLGSVVRGPILNFFLLNSSQSLNVGLPMIHIPSVETVLLTIFIGVIQISVLFGLARLWTSWHGGRA